jgi:hypothetical protein
MISEWSTECQHNGGVTVLLRGVSPPYSPIKMGRSNCDPVLNLYYYKSKRGLLRATGPKVFLLQESTGAWGEIPDTNPDKSFVTPV